MKRKAKILFFSFEDDSSLHVLLGRRISGSEEYWWLPGGSIEDNESAFEAAFRELYEELEPTYHMKEKMSFYKDLNKVPYHIQYTSQSFNTIFFIHLNNYENIQNDLPRIKDEFEEMQWFDPDHLPKNMSRDFKFIAPYINKSYLENCR